MVIILSSISQKDGKFIFTDYQDNEQILLDAVDMFNNRSKISVKRPIQIGNEIFLLKDVISRHLNVLNDESLSSFLHSLALLIIVDKFMQKPQNLQLLQIGDWSKFSDSVVNLFNLFGNKNHLYCLTNDNYSTNIPNVSFIPVKLGDELLPQSRFSMAFIDFARVVSLTSVPAEVFLSLKDGGNLLFLTDLFSMPKTLIDKIKVYLLTDRLAFISLSIDSKIKDDIFKQTSQGKLKAQKQEIIDSIQSLSKIIKKLEFLPENKRISALDDVINSIIKSEKVLMQIYEELNSFYIKPYFNELKEALIDYRLQKDSSLRKVHFEKIGDLFRKILYEMTAQADFALNMKEVI